MRDDAPSATVIEGKVRRPWSVAFLSVATLGLYSLVWYYVVNREMRDFGARHGDDKLASTKPLYSVLAFALGAVIVAPRVISLRRTVRRIQAVERIATGSARPAGGVYAGIVVATLLPLAGSVHRIGPLLVLGAYVALTATITRMQARLNAAWRTYPHIVPSSRIAAPGPAAIPKVTAPVPRPATKSARAQRDERNRRAQDLLKQIDAARLNRSTTHRDVEGRSRESQLQRIGRAESGW